MAETDAKPCFLVDDDPDLRFVLRHCLKRAGFSVCECSSLNDVNDALGHTSPHLIVLDVGLMHSNAGEVLDLLAQRRCNAWVQLISGRSKEELEVLAQTGEELGIRMLPPMTKPFGAGDIRNVAETVLHELDGIQT